MQERLRRDRIAQWAFDTRSILGRFHLWLEDVEERTLTGKADFTSFAGGPLSRALVMTGAVTALGTRLFGRYGEGKGLDKAGINRVKKDADAVSAYAMSEALWYLSRTLPENHALMVSLGEGLMPKAGETPEMGSNPLLGFGRVYARPQVAKFLDHRVHRLLNDDDYGWDEFWAETQKAGITIWGSAIDTLENTSRFALGEETGPMSVLHVFDQPLKVETPYEGYVGTLVLPEKVARQAEQDSLLLTYRTPRAKVLEALQATYSDVPCERVHVWTLGGPSREERLGDLWQEWRDLGVHLVEDGWRIPGGGEVFTDSGTYAPMSLIGDFEDEEGRRHVFLCDGYAASAEAIQAASLDPILETRTALSLFSSFFHLAHHREREVMQLDVESPDFSASLDRLAGRPLDEETHEAYRSSYRTARDAGMPVGKSHLEIDDFFPHKEWRVLAIAGSMLTDPYTDCQGVEQLEPGVYRVTVRASTRNQISEIALTFRLMESFDQSRQVFSPLLDRFYAGQDHTVRPVKISDSGRIRNELQTLCSEGLEYLDDNRIRVRFESIDEAVLSAEKKDHIRTVLAWYKQHHPIWFAWLVLDD